VNRGIPADRVAAATHTQVRKVSIKEQTASAGSGRITRDAGAARSGAVYREQIKAPAHPVKVVAQKLDNSHPVVQHTDIRQAAMDRNQSLNAGQRSNPSAVQSRNQLDSRSSQRPGGLGNSTQPAPREGVQPRNNSRAPQRDLPARDLPATTPRNQRQETPVVTPPSSSRGGRESLQSTPDHVQQPNSPVRQDRSLNPPRNDRSLQSEPRSRIETRDSVPRQAPSHLDNEVPRQYAPKGAQDQPPRAASEAERHSVERRSGFESPGRFSSESRSESRGEARGDNRKNRD
jgi:hypothetical protein